ncbi:Adenylate cyclase [Diplonema papillatum]|nr:Adenylate cyclase [Diplonema papillatum]
MLQKMARRLLGRFLQWFDVPGESQTDRTRKRVWLGETIGLGFLSAFSLIPLYNKPPYNLGAVISGVVSLSGAFIILWLRRLPSSLTSIIVIGQCVSIAIADWGSAALNVDRWWPTFVVVLDLLLVSREGKMAEILVYFVVIWLAVMSVEQSFRFGLLDAPMLPSYENRIGRTCVPDGAACEYPPCAQRTRLTTTLPLQLLVFVLDFWMTRGFAKQVMSEKGRLEASVQAANDVASALAAFDLPRARKSLDTAAAGNLPRAFADALAQLLENLTTYRPYLPDALFDRNEHGGMNANSLTPPGVVPESDGLNVATVVFTDIVQSTAIWNACPEEMKRALQLHNVLIRSALAEYEGYEVKTIGDSFMAAFSKAEDAAKFALAVHARLYSANWPAPLLAIPQCCIVPRKWRGLRVRIGMHQGPVSIERNTLIDRYDYFGPTVNMAARLESNCMPGCIAALPEFVAEIEKMWEPCHLGLGLSVAQTFGGKRTRVLAQCPSAFSVIDESPWDVDVDSVDEWTSAVASRSQTAVLKGIGQVALVIFTPIALQARLDLRLPRNRGPTQGDDEVYDIESVVSSSQQHVTPAHKSAPAGWVLDVVQNATVASVTLGMHDDDAAVDAFQRATDDALATTMQAINQTEGTLMSVVGNAVFVSWNASRRVLGHFQNSLHFTRVVQRNVPRRVHTHISSGKIFAGTVGTEGQKFLTVFGGCVGLTRQLEAVSSALQARAVYCRHMASVIEGRQRNLLRPIGWCRFQAIDDRAERFIVYEVALRENDREGQAAESGWGWSPEYWSLFLNGEYDAIRRRLEGVDDPTLLCALSERNTAWADPALWGSEYSRTVAAS